MPRKPSKLQDRLTEDYLLSYRNSIVDSFQNWKSRISEIDQVIRGEVTVTYPDGTVKVQKPLVANLADTQPRDVARLVSETQPSVSAAPASDKQEDARNATLREAIADTVWEKNNGPLMVPQWAMDLCITGAAFSVSWYDTASPYPHIMRVDPRFCYPDIHNGVVQDLLVVQRIKGRILQRLYQDIDIEAEEDDKGNKAAVFYEVWEYYAADECVRAISRLGSGGDPVGEGTTWIVRRWKPNLECPPIGFAQLPSPDGALRGMLDQIGVSLATKNRAIDYLMNETHQLVYSPRIVKGVLNATEEPGGQTIYYLDPNIPDARVERLAPAGPHSMILNLVQYLDSEQRAQLQYPAQRQGGDLPSIISGAGIASTQGPLTSVVRDMQRLIGSLREQATRASMEIEERYLDFEKPLLRSVGKKRSYTPSKDIAGKYDVQVVYGAGAGLDRLQTDARLLQYYGAGAISARLMLANTDFVSSPEDTMEERQREELSNAIMQRLAGDPSVTLDFLLRVEELMLNEGISISEARKKARAELSPQPEVPVGGEVAGPEVQPSAAEQQLALEKGGVPTHPTPGPVRFSPPPIEQVLIR